ncbi:MAG: cytochrome c3 family protein [Alphaproteobacteria bacterium]|nr:cytochrome c3 family protein [Alphaproteobacteria bacterium]
MTFLIKQISHTADGRQIVRPSEIAADSITIGRAAENDIHLPDLAVTPHHARIDIRDNRHISVTATGGLPFEVDGRSVQNADIDCVKGAELRLGGHRLTIGQDDGKVAIAVERVEALSDASEEKDEVQVFSLRGLLPGKRTGAWGFAILILIAFLAVPIWSYASHKGVKERAKTFHADQSWSSGPLSLAHRSLENNCQACHVDAFVSVRDSACVACHTNVHDHADLARLALAKGTPGIGGHILAGVAHMFNKPDGTCVDCHSEHEGAGPMQPTQQIFCTNCHDGLNGRLIDTKIENVADFGKSHPEFRPAIMTTPGNHPAFTRISLNKRPTENSGLKFPHKLHLSRTNGVARMAQTMKADHGFGNALACKDCHVPTADGVRFQPVDMKQNCAMCHSLAFEEIGGTLRTLRHGEPRQVIADLRAYYRSSGPEKPISLGGMARRRPGQYAQGQLYHAYFDAAAARPSRADAAIRTVFSKGGACYDCHTITPPVAAGSDDWRVMPVHQTMRYMGKGWFDHDAHKTEKCESCHAAAKSDKASDVMLPGIATCRTCHGGPEAKADIPSSCALCHNYHADEGAPWATKQRVAAMNPGTNDQPAGAQDRDK